ncbi:hypothetical protein ELH42_29890 (plasmid) [Rhizobium ruizarguesonis]|uniref:hypothetical protein n=1 Tax=Rhizobium ruizarguesonis TaxID=2081791 RepID=UPI0010310E9B|nr:hypothetical protein [Rhizobium ruizarguesonis]TBB60049.1 hypothetical protein ELH42_29890 [Rhizobium ruizarguesonis]
MNDEIKSLASRSLIQRARSVCVAEFGDEMVAEFSLRHIRAAEDGGYIENWLHGKPRLPAVYTITAANDVTIRALVEAFPGRDRNNPHGYARPQLNNTDANMLTLYVGSSETVVSRLKEHLWQAHAKTYALNLRRWCPNADGSVIVRIQPILRPVDRQVMQDLESALWRSLTPHYGKLGSR